MMRFSGFVLVGWFVLGCGAAAADLAPVTYDLKTVIEPGAGSVSVTGAIDVPVEKTAREITFGLHRTFSITALAADGKAAGFTYRETERSPFNPGTRTVIVRLPEGASADGAVRVAIAYAGTLEKFPEWGTSADQKWAMDDQINARMVQLASYSSWYPQFFSFGQTLAYELEVSLPKGWSAVSAGAEKKLNSKKRAVTHWSCPRNIDIVISAAPDFRRHSAALAGLGYGIDVYETAMPAETVNKETRDLAAAVSLFTATLGPTSVPGGMIRHVYLPMEHGMGRAGIARLGIVVTSEGRVKEAMAHDPGYNLFQDVAHEIAHFWWHFGEGQGDWINESFAEYFSALAVREVVSPAQFDSVIARYRERVAALPSDAPPLASVPAGGDFYVRYYKGSLMLDALRRAMGDEAFMAAAREFFQACKDRRIGTAEFRSFWGAKLGDRKALLDTWLDSGGGLPGA